MSRSGDCVWLQPFNAAMPMRCMPPIPKPAAAPAAARVHVRAHCVDRASGPPTATMATAAEPRVVAAS